MPEHRASIDDDPFDLAWSNEAQSFLRANGPWASALAFSGQKLKISPTFQQFLNNGQGLSWNEEEQYVRQLVLPAAKSALEFEADATISDELLMNLLLFLRREQALELKQVEEAKISELAWSPEALAMLGDAGHFGIVMGRAGKLLRHSESFQGHLQETYLLVCSFGSFDDPPTAMGADSRGLALQIARGIVESKDLSLPESLENKLVTLLFWEYSRWKWTQDAETRATKLRDFAARADAMREEPGYSSVRAFAKKYRIALGLPVPSQDLLSLSTPRKASIPAGLAGSLDLLTQLVNRGKTQFSVAEVWAIVHREHQTQCFAEFQNQIVSVKPQTTQQYLRAYLKIWGADRRFWPWLELLIRERGGNPEEILSQSAIEEARSVLRLEAFEQELHSDFDSVPEEVDLMSSDAPLENNAFDFSPDEFESMVAHYFEREGYTVRQIGGSGDQGADVILERDGTRTVVQCKRYQGSVGNTAVQEAHAARAHHGAVDAIVVTTGRFTASAQALARTTGVRLVNWNDLLDPV